jgi:hypothetical protein
MNKKEIAVLVLMNNIIIALIVYQTYFMHTIPMCLK